MESPTQLDLLKERIAYNKFIFGEEVTYYEYANNDDKVYTLSSQPKANDMTYLYENEVMVENKPITSIGFTNDIVVDGTTYTSTDKTIVVCETYIKVLKRLLEDSKYVGLSLRFPYQDYSNIDLPKKYYNWQLRCAEEIYKGIGTVGIKSYAENGLSWTRDSGYISYELRGEIEPMVGAILIEDEEADTNV